MVDWKRLAHRLGVALNLRDPPNVPPYGWSYFDHLVAIYVTLNRPDERAAEVIKKSRQRAEDLTWGDVFLLESVVFSLQPPEAVDRTAWIYRERLREISSPAVFEKYVGSHPPTDADTPEKFELLRADLTRVLDVLHWYYTLTPIRERKRKSLTIDCLIMVVIYTLVLGVALWWFNRTHMDFLATLTCVTYCGTIGGFVSSQRRMQNIPTDGDPLISVFGLDNAGYYLWLSPLLGAIFAVLLMLMFIGGVLKGSMFPEFVTTDKTVADGLFDIARSAIPTSAAEFGKLFVWTFIAGFAERLVPDSIDRLTDKVGQSSTSTVRPSGGVLPKDGDLDAHAQARQAGTGIPKATMQDVLHTGELHSAEDNSAEMEEKPMAG